MRFLIVVTRLLTFGPKVYSRRTLHARVTWDEMIQMEVTFRKMWEIVEGEGVGFADCRQSLLTISVIGWIEFGECLLHSRAVDIRVFFSSSSYLTNGCRKTIKAERMKLPSEKKRSSYSEFSWRIIRMNVCMPCCIQRQQKVPDHNVTLNLEIIVPDREWPFRKPRIVTDSPNCQTNDQAVNPVDW